VLIVVAGFVLIGKSGRPSSPAACAANDESESNREITKVFMGASFEATSDFYSPPSENFHHMYCLKAGLTEVGQVN
jgi:hypothetical protein